jgi:hypothetical protein
MQTETVFAIELLALAAGIGLLGLAGIAGISAKALVKATGCFISIAAIATMLSTAYFEIKFACGDYHESPLMEQPR